MTADAGPPRFEDWYAREHPRVASALTAVCGNPALAADVADEAFARALERWERVSTMASPGGWTFRTALNGLRRTRRRAALEQRLLRRDPPPAVARPLEWDVEVFDAVRALPDRQRLAVALHYIGDLSVADTAAVMGVRPGTVMATLHAARANLAKALASHDPTLQELPHGRG